MRSNTAKLLLVMCVLLATSICRGEIIETMRFDTLKNYVKPTSLIILDIDNTLMIPIQELGTDQWFYHRIKRYEREGLNKAESLEKALAEWTAIQSITKVRVVEQGTQGVIKQLQDEGFTIMGLTTRGLGLSHRTIEQLKSIDIDLSITSPTDEDVYFMNGQGVLFRSGILFTSGTHKGEAFKKFIDAIKYKVDSVVFINDKGSHIKELQETIVSLGIPFIGLRYGYLDEKVKNFSQDLSDIQWEHFGHILSDEDANAILQVQ
jgi:Protein of unknown function (DUF2608)